MSNTAVTCPHCKRAIRTIKFDHIAGTVTNQPCGCQTPASSTSQASGEPS